MKKLIAVAVIVATAILLFVSRNQLLHRGASNGQSALMKFALAIGADKNSHAEDGNTPLIAAAAAGQGGALDRLIAAGADVDRKNRDTGATALMEAAVLGDSDIVDSLLAAGASVSARDNENHTAYWYAFDNEQFAIARKVHYIPQTKVKVASAGGGSSGDTGGDGSSMPGDSVSQNDVRLDWRDVRDVELTVDEVNAVLGDGEVREWKSRPGFGRGQMETKVTKEEMKKVSEEKARKLLEARSAKRDEMDEREKNPPQP